MCRFMILIALLCALGGCSSDVPVAAGAGAGSDSEKEFDHPPMEPVDADANDPQSLERALEKNPGHTPVLMRMAELALERGDAAKAAEHLREAVAADPDDLDARLELGRALYEAGDPDGAQAETQEILDRDPGHVDALYNMGAIHANQKRAEQAIEYWSKAVAAAPNSPSGHSAQRGLDILGGRAVNIPDIPEHQGVLQNQMPDIPEHRGVRAGAPASSSLSNAERSRIVEFANRAPQ